MNRKLLLILSLILCLTGCQEKNEKETVKPEYTYDIVSKAVDMSAYEGVTSTKHNFREINVSELFHCIDAKSSGIFYLGRSNCGCCQRVCRYINETAMELGVVVYYIDVYNEEEPLTDQALQDQLYEYLYDILGTDEEGEKALLTPHLFAVINGELGANQICFDGLSLDLQPTEQQVNALKEVYANIMEPFVE